MFRLYFNKNKPDFAETIKVFQDLINYYGIPFDSNKLDELIEKKTKEKENLDIAIREYISERTGEKCGYINYTGRLVTRTNIAAFVTEVLGLREDKFISKKGNYSFKLSDIEYLISDRKKYDYPRAEEEIEFLENIYNYLNTSRLISSTDQLSVSRGLYKNKVVNAYKEMYNEDNISFDDIKDKLRDKNLFYVYPTFSELATGRISTSKPNIQGLGAEVKELMTAPKGYKIASVDIKGQDAHILICGILDNPIIKELYVKYGDPYRAIIEAAGFEFNKSVRDDTKVIILGVMNGMSLSTALSDVKDKELGKTIYNLIVEDSGYKKIVVKYVNENKYSKTPMRTGLFGTKKKVSVENMRYKNSLANQLKNGFFQQTAAEIVTLSINGFLTEIKDNPNITFNDIRLLTPIYDEFVMVYREDLEEYALDIFKSYFMPSVEDWPIFRGEVLVGDTYRSKE